MRVSNVLVGLFLVSLSTSTGCFEPKSPPADTPMVPISTGLVFDFGADEPCFSPRDMCAQKSKLDLVRNSNDAPQVSVEINAFEIDQHEVTNAQYRLCVEHEVCQVGFDNAVDETQQHYYSDEHYASHPVVNISWEQAQVYCDFVGKRLPTEFEWERVAKGPHSERRYPAEISGLSECIEQGLVSQQCGHPDQTLVAVSPASGQAFVSEPGGKIYNLFGSVSEWTSSAFAPDLTCQETSAPCKPCWACDSDPVCEQQCESCQACPNLPGQTPDPESQEGFCHFACVGEVNQTVRCLAYPKGEAVSVDSLRQAEPSEQRRVVRGGSVQESGCDEVNTCSLESSYRMSLSQAEARGHIGFRCARDLPAVSCEPLCEDRVCGADGCGGSCGTCPEGERCDAGGASCSCAPACAGKSCGDDGCGGQCGPGCDSGASCIDGACCSPSCRAEDGSFVECGDDGCGGSCGDCGAAEVCSPQGLCLPE